MDDPDILPYYPFRDDAILYYDIIKEYVTSYTKLYYGKLNLVFVFIAKSDSTRIIK